ncbi:hypothetical protein L7F22_041277 [Adiantum nelumboides]|nr:hypothetical protein [Adiantum nelumboides]
MAVNESRRTLAGYSLFYGEPGEDADLFVANFKMALRINHIRDPVESLGLFEVTLRKSANTWFTALTPPLNQDFEQVLIAFRAHFGQAQNPQKLWKEILLIRQRTLDDYLTYRQAFNTAWTIWLQSLPNPGDEVEFLKKEQFTAGLIPTLRLKVESGDPVTYHDAERRAYQKYRKLKCLEEEPLPVLRPREVPIQVSNIAPIPVVPMAAGPSTQPAMIDNEVLERLNESLTNLSIHLAQGVGPRGTIPRSPQERPIRPRSVLTCWNCGEEGHGINNCPYPRGGYGQPPQQLPYPRNHANDPPPRGPVTILQRQNPPLAPIREEAPIPPLPDPGVHVVEVASVRPPAYAEALANGIKQTRGKEKEDTMREESIPSGREHKREKGETSKRRRRRRINLHDFPLGHGMSPYNLIEDLQAKGPSISWPQFFALCPQVRREMAKAISTRIPKKKGNVVRIAPVEMEDIVPTIDCFIKGTLVQKGLVDGGAQIFIMTEATMHRLNLKIHKTPEVRVKMADNSKAKCLGMVRDVRVDALGVKQELDFYIMSFKGNGYPLILGRPWLIKMGVKQDWEIGELICERAGKKIVYDMKEKRHEEVSHESTTSESEEDLEDTTSSSEDLSSSSEEGSSVIDVPPPPPKVIPNVYTLFFDGAFRRGVGKAGGGLVLLDPEGKVDMEETLVLTDSMSNNEAKFHILILGLKACISRGIKRLMVKGDALLVVKQVMGVWACKSEKLKGKVRVIRSLLSQFSDVQLYHIPPKENQRANDLAQRAVKEVITLAAASLKPPRFEGLEALAPIVSYILEGEFPPGLTSLQRKRLIKRASSYLWLDGVLYQKGKDLVCRRVPSCKEIPLILKSLHEEACGGHFAHDLTARKILHAGYVWPTLHVDAQHWCRTCHQCQINGDRRLIHGPRHPVVANGPFEKWGIDAIGRLPRTADGKLYILVAIDYMTKWVEAQSISRVTESTVSKFVYSHICCKLGAPQEIISDHGPRFREGLLTRVCEEMKVKHQHATPYYPQSNGAVEKANGIITRILRKMVESQEKHWDRFLDGALWAYRTTYKCATGFTPFHLVYGQEALQPIELEIPTIRAIKNEGNEEESLV